MATCRRCLGKLKARAAKDKNGKNVYQCQSCKRKYVLDEVRGGLREVSPGKV